LSGISGPIDLAHSSGAERCDDLVVAEASPGVSAMWPVLY
jgi:hypothetical protein